TSVKIEDLAAGDTVQATCSGCRTFKAGKTRAFKAYKTTARKSGDLVIAQLKHTLVPKGKALVVVITRGGQIGRRYEIRMGKKKRSKGAGCLALGSTTSRVKCPVDS